jgi:ATP-dependent Lon protease
MSKASILHAMIQATAGSGGALDGCDDVEKVVSTSIPYTKIEAAALAQEIQAASGYALNDYMLERLQDALLVGSGLRPVSIEGLCGENHFELLKDLVRTAGQSDSQVIFAAVKCAIKMHTSQNMALWCDGRKVFSDFQRIAHLSKNERSDDDEKYFRELTNVLEAGLLRQVAGLPDVQAVLNLATRFPNFMEPIRFVAEQAALARLKKIKDFRVPPLLFVGSPGIGKTYFALALAELLDSLVETISMSGATSGMMLSGLDRGWGTSRPGMIYSSIARGTSLSPVLILDELDKANTGGQYDPIGPLYQLLEPRTAANFRDEFVGFGMDTTRIVWIATANELSNIPEALRSRFQIFEIADPDEAQMRLIAGNLFAEMSQGLPGAPAKIPDEWLERLGKRSLRDIRVALQRAFGRAAIRASEQLSEVVVFEQSDLETDGKEKVRRNIGFVN